MPALVPVPALVLAPVPVPVDLLSPLPLLSGMCAGRGGRPRPQERKEDDKADQLYRHRYRCRYCTLYPGRKIRWSWR